MKQKLIKIFSINFLNAGLNFITTVLIVKLFGLETFGQFVIFSSYIGLTSLIYVILPPSYAVFKIQDIKYFKNILVFNYIIASIFISGVIYLISFFIDFNIPILYIIIFIIINAIISLFDIYFQAINKLNQYFLILLINSIFKIIFITISYLNQIDSSLNTLILLNIFSVCFGIIYGIIISDLKIIFSKRIFYKYILHIKNNTKVLKSYYINVGLKRLKDNATILVFSIIFTPSIIGLYSLFTKISSFVLGQARVIETFFMNRKNMKNISILENKKYIIAFIMQIFILIIGLIYLQFTLGKLYFIELFIYSFIAYPYINFIFIRNKLMSKYQINILNIMYLFYITLVSIIYIVSLYISMNFLFLIFIVLILEIINILVVKIQLNKLNNVGLR